MPHPVDIHVGQRLRQRRWMLGLTQQQLGERVGIRFQQVQKYETGENRMSASRLFDLAAALNVPVAHFYQGLGGRTAPEDDGAEAGEAEQDGAGGTTADGTTADGAADEEAAAEDAGVEGVAADGSALLQDRETIQLVRAFYAMPRAQRQHLFDLARVLSHDD